MYRFKRNPQGGIEIVSNKWRIRISVRKTKVLLHMFVIIKKFLIKRVTQHCQVCDTWSWPNQQKTETISNNIWISEKKNWNRSDRLWISYQTNYPFSIKLSNAFDRSIDIPQTNVILQTVNFVFLCLDSGYRLQESVLSNWMKRTIFLLPEKYFCSP